MRTVKSVLEDDPNLMPPKSVCTTCPTKEYETLKKNKDQTTKVMRLKSKNEIKLQIKHEDRVQSKIKQIQEKMKKKKSKKEKKEKKLTTKKTAKNREKRTLTKTPKEICVEKGNGLWSDPTDCKKYYLCRNHETPWGEIVHETCWQGSYFDKTDKKCKYVGVTANFECDESEAETEQETAQSALMSSLNTTIDSMEEKETNFDSETLQTLSTCKPDYETNPDYVKCYDCDSKNEPKCNYKPMNLTSPIWCNIKKKKCFSKAVYKAPNNLLQSFSRGCSTVIELVGSNIPTRNFSKGFCYRNSNSTKSCVILCDSNLCNKEVTGRASRAGPVQPQALKLEANNSKKITINFKLFILIIFIYLN